MKKKWYFLGCLSAFVFVGLFFVIIIAGVAKIDINKEIIHPDSYLHVALSGPVQEYSQFKDDFFIDLGVADAHTIIANIKAAKSDPRIKGLVLEPRGIACGFSTLNNIREAIIDFKDSGKEIIAFTESAAGADYLLLTAADKIIMNPSASSEIILTGTGVSMLFFKDLMDKIGVDMKLFHSGKFKGTGENYTRNSLSEYSKQNLKGIVDSFYEKKIQMIADARSELDYEAVRKIYEERPDMFISPDNAMKYKLVDRLEFRHKLYQEKSIETKRLVKVTKYEPIEKPVAKGDKIAVLYAVGAITNQKASFGQNVISAKSIDKICRKIEKDPTIKAVVLRVNCPGGSAMESDIILDRLYKLNQTKPIVVSMGDVAASGGYYISCGADYVMAEDFAITGSIGVVSMFPNFNRLSKKIGVHEDHLTRGKFTNMFNPWTKGSKEFDDSFQRYSDMIYADFKAKVIAGRKDKLTTDLEKIAQGKIWTAEAAKKHGLIDEVGTLAMAIKKAEELAGISESSIITFPKQKGFFETIVEEKMGKEMIESAISGNDFYTVKAKELKKVARSFVDEPVQLISPVQVENFRVEKILD